MDDVLRLSALSPDDRGRAAAALAKRLARWEPGAASNPAEGISLALATALFLTRMGKVVAEDYRGLLRDVYAAEIFQDAVLADVNAWSNRKTGGLVPTIINALHPDDVFVVLAAIHLRADWLDPFDADMTADAPFELATGERVSVPTMHQTNAYATLRGPGYRAIRMPYDGDSLAMIVVLPDAASSLARLSHRHGDGLEQTLPRLDADGFAQLAAELVSEEPRKTALALPRFSLTTSTFLAAPFIALGMTRPFGLDADLSGMTGGVPTDPPLLISQIIQKAVIEVEEHGTKAAAVVAVVARAGSAGGFKPPEPFVVDRPFLFFVADHATGAVLFQGQVGDPRGAAE